MIENVQSHKTPKGSRRSSKWPAVRAAFLRANPTCAVCGGKRKLEVHHIRPFHLDPELELDPLNLITLCEDDDDGVNCHLLVGHLGSFKSFNKTVREDASEWNEKIKGRPKGDAQ